MSDQELNNKIAELMNVFIKKVAMYIVAAAGSGIVAMIVFYFSTTNTLANHAKDIQDLSQSKASSESVQSIKTDIQHIRDQQDKMINLFLEKR